MQKANLGSQSNLVVMHPAPPSGAPPSGQSHSAQSGTPAGQTSVGSVNRMQGSSGQPVGQLGHGNHGNGCEMGGGPHGTKYYNENLRR